MEKIKVYKKLLIPLMIKCWFISLMPRKMLIGLLIWECWVISISWIWIFNYLNLKKNSHFLIISLLLLKILLIQWKPDILLILILLIEVSKLIISGIKIGSIIIITLLKPKLIKLKWHFFNVQHYIMTSFKYQTRLNL